MSLGFFGRVVSICVGACTHVKLIPVYFLGGEKPKHSFPVTSATCYDTEVIVSQLRNSENVND